MLPAGHPLPRGGAKEGAFFVRWDFPTRAVKHISLLCCNSYIMEGGHSRTGLKAGATGQAARSLLW